MNETPYVIALAGPNGAGKSSTAPAVLNQWLGLAEFVNADVIARGLSGFEPERAAVSAGRIMLKRMRELARARASFAFETTLSGRALASWIVDLRSAGYAFHVVFLWLQSADAAVARVAERVRLGGHDVPESVIRRRYDRGLRNFLTLYRPLAQSWQVYNNSGTSQPEIIAIGAGSKVTRVLDSEVWRAIERWDIHEGRRTD